MGKWTSTCLALGLIGVASAGHAQQLTFDHQPTFLQTINAPQSPVVAQSLKLNPSERSILEAAAVGESIDMPALTLGLAKGAPMQFRRIAIRAPGARVWVDDGIRATPLGPSDRRFFLAHSATGGASFSYDTKTGRAHGLLVDGGTSYQLDGKADTDGGLTLNLASLQQARSNAGFACGQDDTHQPEFRAADIDLKAVPGLQSALYLGVPSMRAARKGGGQVLYQAVVAVDTDNELLFNKFSNNTGNARDWIEDMFVAMNAFYEPDLGLRLLLGDLRLRVDNSPSGGPDFNNDPEDFNDGLSQFRSYFQNNRNGVSRNFAALLSGKDISSNSFSGVAYVGAYCSSFSYSINRIGSAGFISPAFIAGGVGHELGHNLGSSHTHCESLRAGGGFVDECYSGDRGGCYEGPTSCPSNADGSLMSYCHAGADGFDGSGPAVGTSERCNVSDYFHPLIIGKLDNRIAANNPSCIADFSVPDLLFGSSFE